MNKKDYIGLIASKLVGFGYVTDISTYEIKHINRALSNYLKIDGEQAEGDKCYKVIYSLDKPCDFCNIEKLKTNLNKTLKHYRYNDKLGRYFAMKNSLVTDGDTTLRVEVSYDVTEEYTQIQAFKQKMELDHAVIECAQTFFGDSNSSKFMQNLLKTVCNYFNANRAYIFEVDYPKHILTNTHEYCNEGILPSIEELKEVTIDAVSHWFAPGGKDIYLNADNELIDEKTVKIFVQAGGNGLSILTPLTHNELIIGFIGIESPHQNGDEVNLLHTTAGYITSDIQRRKLVHELEMLTCIDEMTGFYNRSHYLKKIRQLRSAPPSKLGIIYIDINGLKRINHNLGYEYGDIVLKWCAKFLTENISQKFYRTGGDEFICIGDNVSYREFHNNVNTMRNKLSAMSLLNMSIGHTWVNSNVDIDKQMVETDKLMNIEKDEYYRLKAEFEKESPTQVEHLRKSVLSLQKDLE